MEELFKEQVGPLVSYVEWASLRRDVGCVQTHLNQLLLGLKLSGCVRVINQFLSVLTVFNSLLFDQ